MSNYQAPEPIILDARHGSWSGPSTQEGKWGALFYGVNTKGEITLRVYTNDDNDKNGPDKGMIKAALTPRQFGMYIAAIRQAIATPQGQTFDFAMTSEEFKFFGPGKRSDTRLPIWRLVVRRLEDGRIVKMLLDPSKEGRPRIVFDFAPALHTNVLGAGGQPMDKGMLSQICAQGFVDTIPTLILPLASQRYVHKAPNQGGNQGGGYNNNRNNGGGYNNGGNRGNGSYQGGGNQGGYNSAPSSDNLGDDIPF